MAHVRAGGARHSFLHGVCPFRRVRDDVSIRLVELGVRQAVMMDHDLVSQAMKEAQRLSVDRDESSLLTGAAFVLVKLEVL
jgi:hypothetical protein